MPQIGCLANIDYVSLCILHIIREGRCLRDSVGIQKIVDHIHVFLGHGHDDVTKTRDETLVLERTEDNVTANAKLMHYAEITEEKYGAQVVPD